MTNDTAPRETLGINEAGVDTFDREMQLIDAGLAELCRRSGAELVGGCRRIRNGDYAALREVERLHLAGAVSQVLNESGAVRIVARALVMQFGCGEVTFPRAVGEAAAWPPGLIGSMAHDTTFAVAVAGRKSALRSVGIDLEPHAPLPAGVLDLVATLRERHQLQTGKMPERLLFCIKEAVFKATHPIDGIFLEPHDIEYYADSGTARTRTGRVLRILTDDRAHLLALACL